MCKRTSIWMVAHGPMSALRGQFTAEAKRWSSLLLSRPRPTPSILLLLLLWLQNNIRQKSILSVGMKSLGDYKNRQISFIKRPDRRMGHACTVHSRLEHGHITYFASECACVRLLWARICEQRKAIYETELICSSQCYWLSLHGYCSQWTNFTDSKWPKKWPPKHLFNEVFFLFVC